MTRTTTRATRLALGIAALPTAIGLAACGASGPATSIAFPSVLSIDDAIDHLVPVLHRLT